MSKLSVGNRLFRNLSKSSLPKYCIIFGLSFRILTGHLVAEDTAGARCLSVYFFKCSTSDGECVGQCATTFVQASQNNLKEAGRQALLSLTNRNCCPAPRRRAAGEVELH